jgi:hypothetical protein
MNAVLEPRIVAASTQGLERLGQPAASFIRPSLVQSSCRS